MSRNDNYRKTSRGVIVGNLGKYGEFVRTIHHGPEEGTRVGYFLRNIPTAIRLYGWCLAFCLWLIYTVSGGYIKLVRTHFNYFSELLNDSVYDTALTSAMILVAIYFVYRFIEMLKSGNVWLRILSWLTVAGILVIFGLYIAWRVHVSGIKVTAWNENSLYLKWREQEQQFYNAFIFLIIPAVLTIAIRDHFKIYKSIFFFGLVIPFLLRCVENPYFMFLSIVTIVKVILLFVVIFTFLGLVCGEGASGAVEGFWVFIEV